MAWIYGSTVNTPMQDSMLWVYEGLTESWGLQIAPESGLISNRDYRDLLAMDAAEQILQAWTPVEVLSGQLRLTNPGADNQQRSERAS